MEKSIISSLQPKNAYWVGGCVRDTVMGRSVQDLDIAISQDAKETAKNLALSLNAPFISLGGPDTPLYRIVTPHYTIDITPLRNNDILTDLKSRDFTLNAMAAKISSNGLERDVQESLLDPLDGFLAIEQKTIQMISEENILSDPVRMLRCYRLKAQLPEFSVSPELNNIICAHAHKISAVAAERVREELFKLLGAFHAYPAILAMSENTLLTTLFPELIPLKGCTQNKWHDFDVFTHTLNSFRELEALLSNASIASSFLPASLLLLDLVPIVKLSILLHDIGKPGCRSVDEKNQVRFLGHEKLGAQKAFQIAKRLKLSRFHREVLSQLITHHLRPLNLYQGHMKKILTQKGETRFCEDCHSLGAALIFHAVADMLGKTEKAGDFTDKFLFFTRLRTLLARYQALLAEPALVDGNDLQTLFNLIPSSYFQEILFVVQSAQFHGEINDRTEALEYVRNYIQKYPPVSYTN